MIVKGDLARYPFVVVLGGLVTVILGLALGRWLGLPGVVWGAGLGLLVTTPFLVRRNALMLGIKVRPMIVATLLRSLRCSGLGIGACVAYVLSGEFGVGVPWAIGMIAAMLVGALGFVIYGLLPQDRSTLVSWLSRAGHATA